MRNWVSVFSPLRHDTVLKSMRNFWHCSFSFLRCLENEKQGPPIFTIQRLYCLSYMFSPSLSLAHPLFILPLFGSREPNKCGPAVSGGLEQPILYIEVIQCVFSPTLSLSIFLCASLSQLQSVLSCILSPFFSALTHFPSFFLKALLSSHRLAGDKTWSLGEERDIWEQDGERDRGHVPTWSPSPGFVETLTARRWVPFTSCMQHPAVQHLWIRCNIKFM